MLIRILIVFCLLTSLSFASPSGVQEAWKGFSRPEIMRSGLTHQFEELPLEGHIPIGPKAWSGPYWASQKGGINIRWNSPTQEGFNYKSPTKAQVQQMSLEELSKLSATEKYDLYLGQYDYPMKARAATAASSSAPDWAGICHGWAPASLYHNEPTPKFMTNPDGIIIPFGSSDIKALLSYYYAHHFVTDSSHQVGLRCSFGPWMGGARSCLEDLNAGAFHIILANMIGLRQEGFIADIDRYKEVWNQPVVGYQSKVIAANLKPSPRAATKAVKEMRIATDFFYINEVKRITWDVVHGTSEQRVEKLRYVYRIELDAKNQIVGGEWESEKRPDFLWNKQKETHFKGILSSITELLND